LARTKQKKEQEQTMNRQLIRNTAKVGIIALMCLIYLGGSSAFAQVNHHYGAGAQIRLNSGIGITFGGGRVGVNFGGGYYPYQNYGNYRYPYYNQRPYYPQHNYGPRYYPTPYRPTPYVPAPYYQPRYYQPRYPERAQGQEQEQLRQEIERHQREMKRILTDR
jgi:hypothetical protein